MDEEFIAALLRERSGYEYRLKVAEEELAAAEPSTLTEGRKEYLEREIKDCKGSVGDVNKALGAAGHKAAPPAKRAEKRPAVATEKRGPGRPRKTE